MTLPLATFLAVSLAAAPDPSARRVAVLDFSASWASQCAGGVAADAALRERCELLHSFADQARSGALAVLGPPRYLVMTRENTAELLKDMAGACTEGACEVETARLVGAAYVLSGSVSYLDFTWVAAIKLHDVTSAALLGTGVARGKSQLEAFDAVRAETERMLRASFGADGELTAPVAVAVGDDVPWRWAFEVGGGYSLLSDLGIAPEEQRQSLRSDSKWIRTLSAMATWRFADAWSLQAGFWQLENSEVGPDGAYAMLGSLTTQVAVKGLVAPHAGLAFWPSGNRKFAFVAEVGWILADVEFKGATAGRTVASEAFPWRAPWFGLGVRLEYPFTRNWYLGARAGFLPVKVGPKKTLTTVAGQATFLGEVDLIPLALAFGYRY